MDNLVMATEFSKLIGRNIRYYRDLKGYTQAKLAEEIGCEPSTLGHIEIGKNLPSTSKIEQIAIALDIPAYSLFINRNNNCNEDTITSINELLTTADKKQLKIIYDLIYGILSFTSGK